MEKRQENRPRVFGKTFDIIIPVCCPGEKFEKLLGMLTVQTVRPGKVIIMETVESEAASEKLREILDNALSLKAMAAGNSSAIPYEVYPVRKQDFDHAGTRREAVTYTEADIFIMMTQDAVPADENLCAELIKGFLQQGAAMCYASQIAFPEAGDIERVTREFNYPAKSAVRTEADIETLGIRAFCASDVCCAYDRKIYEELGSFTYHAVFNEDMIYARKVLDNGFNIVYAADARCYHSHNYSASEQFHRNFDLGMSQADHPEVFGNVKSESEGVKLVLNTIKRISPLHIPGLFIQTAAKYLGYRAGKAYKKLKPRTVEKLAQNKEYVKKHIIRPHDYSNILLMGCDVYEDIYVTHEATEDEKWMRSDVMIVVSLHRRTGRISLLNLDRDAWVYIPGHGMNKLNAAVVIGGPELSMKIIKDAYGLNISKYAMINMCNMVDLVDSLGGVDMYLTNEDAAYIDDNVENSRFSTDKWKIKVPPLKTGGLCHLNGLQTLQHMRNRYNGSRKVRVNYVMKALIYKVKKNYNLLGMVVIALSSMKYVKTNIGIPEVVRLLYYGRKIKLKELETYVVPGEGTFEIRRDGPWRRVVDFEKAEEEMWEFLSSPRNWNDT